MKVWELREVLNALPADAEIIAYASENIDGPVDIRRVFDLGESDENLPEGQTNKLFCIEVQDQPYDTSTVLDYGEDK
jgi:hypothetical protein